jgi:hypothetical protein
VGKLVGLVASAVPGRQRPAPQPVAARRTTQPAPPRTPREIALAELWAAVLGADQIDAQVPFLESGGSSLGALKLVTLAQERGFTFTLRELLSADGTVRYLASR